MTRSHAFFLTLPAKIGPDTNSHKLVVAEARFWPQRRLAIRTMTQDLIGCCNYRKLKALIPLEAVFADDPLSAVRGILLPFFIVLRSSGSKICLNMCHGNSENSDGCPNLFRICLIYET